MDAGDGEYSEVPWLREGENRRRAACRWYVGAGVDSDYIGNGTGSEQRSFDRHRGRLRRGYANSTQLA